MSKSISISAKLLAFLLALAAVLSLVCNIPISAKTLSDGQSSYVTIKLNETHYILETQGGAKLQGQSWTYTSDSGITGPAYCINWGLAIPAASTQMPISGRYTATPQTLGAFANGYPQRPLEDFIALNKDEHPILENLTRIEYVAATQAAVWATLGQLAIDGTQYTSGRDTLKVPTTDPSQLRAYEALMIILYNASFWDRPLLTGMHIRLGWTEPGNTLNIEDENGLAGAEQKGLYGIAKETIGGVEYYTRSFIASSATSTFKNGYTIDLRLENAPTGTILADANGTQLSSYEAGGATYWSVPTPDNKHTSLNQNGSEYAGEFKVCIPVDGAPDSGNITFHASAVITQYDIYLANNSIAREQSFVIADPMYTDMSCTGAMTWAKAASPHGRLVVNKTDGMGSPLADAVFTLTGTDGSTYEGTSDAAGQIVWENLDPSITYTLTETQTPAGYIKAEDVAVTLTAGATTTVSVQNLTENTLRIRKIDAQNGSPLIGATFRIEQINGGFVTEITTNHTGVIELTSAQLPYGSYRISEKAAPEGYEPSGEVQTVDWNGAADVTLTFENVRKMSFVIVKADAETGIPLGGVSFEVYKDGMLITTVTTDTAGYATVSGLTEGYYEVREAAAPEGYILDTARHGIHLDPYDPATEADPILLITNSRKPGIRILKIDAETGAGLENARFRIQGVDSSYVQELVTDKNGEIALDNLTPGVYEVSEIAAPAGYIRSDEVRAFEAEAGSNIQLVFENRKKPSLTIKKYDSLTGEMMAGTTFEVYRDTTLVGVHTTDADGEIRLYGLAAGTYTVQEIATDDDHIVNSTPQSIEITADSLDTALLVFLNNQKPYIRLVKLDSETMQPLTNAAFTFKKIGSTYEKEYTTDENGEIRLDRLESGTYTVTETKAPDGYLIGNASRTVKIDGNEYATFVFTDTKKPSLKILKYDRHNDKYLSGATFRIAKVEDGSNYLDRITDIDGSITIDDLEPGVYSVREIKAPAGYVPNETEYHVELFPGKESQLVVLNEEKPNLRIVKTDAITGEPIAGVEFLVRLADGSKVNTVVTDANGEALLTHLEPDVYEVIEKSVPNGYLPDSEPKLVTLIPNRTSVVRFENHPKPSLTVNKVDSIMRNPLENARFSVIYASNATFTGEINDLGIYSTDENGQIKLYNLSDGWYKITETAAPDGYALVESSQEIYIRGGENKTVTFENMPLSGLVIRKVDADTGTPLQGARFEVRYLSGTSGSGGTVIGEYATSANGTIVINRLKAGTYVIEEIKAPDGYIISNAPQTVYISGTEQDVVTVTFENKRDGGLIIRKLDSVTGEALAGAEFTVTTSDGKFVGTDGGAVTSNGIYTTDKTGQIHITGIEAGTTVVVTETKAPDGYVPDTVSKTVKIDDGDTQTLTFYNHPSGALVIKKLDKNTGEPLYGATFKITDSAGTVVGNRNGAYTTNLNGIIYVPELPADTYIVTEVLAPDGYTLDSTPQTAKIKSGETHELVFLNEPLGGIRVTKLDEETRQPIKGVQYDISHLSGERIGTYTTNASGVINVDNLPDGWYTAVEVNAADGYILDSEPHDIEVADGEITRVTLTNRKSSSFFIHKVDAATGKGIYGVTFLISDRHGNPIAQYVTDQNGYVYMDSRQLEDGKYFIREIGAPNGYVIDPEIKTFYVEYGHTASITWYNQPVQAQIQLIKKSADDNPINGIPAGTLLEGAVFEICDKAGNVVDTVTTDKNGRASSKPLPLGLYTIRETAAPMYYTANDTIMNAHLEFNGQIMTFEVLNKSIRLGVSVSKYGYNEVMPDNPLVYSFRHIANTSSVPLESFYFRDTLPSAIRAEQLVTGTFNQSLSYKIVYLTNLSNGEYRTVNDNLSTSRNYVIDISNVALGLAENEYLTEIMYVFGRVKAGFAQVESPQLYARSVRSLANGASFVNMADVGGIYNGQWITTISRWVTRVYSYTQIEMPGTGY